MKITKKETEVWNGTHRGINFEINHFKIAPNSIDERGKDCWTHYIYLHIDRIPEQYKPETFWLKGKQNGSHIMYGHNEHPIIGEIEMHGGCTWYSKEYGFDGAPKVIKIGCDYQHLWDENQHYNLDYVQHEVEKTIDSFLNFVPDYKYWCCGNGKLYDLKEGILIGESFHSLEYWSNVEWFKEKYLTVKS